MTNREKALERINEYLAKQEPQKVELALDLGGLKSYASNLKSKFKTYNNKFLALDDLAGDIKREAKELDALFEKFEREVDEQQKLGQKQAKELGLRFEQTPIGKEWEKIAGDILSGNYSTIKKGLRINIS